MSQLLYEHYQTLEQDALFDILLHAENYQKEAIPVARRVIAEKGWTNELDQRIKKEEEENAIEEANSRIEIEEKAAYYKNVVDFKNQGNSFQVRIPDVPKFEMELHERNIPYFREDKNIGVQLDTYPTQTYYLQNKDVDAVDQLTKDLGLITAPYADIKPFFRFELAVIVVVVFIMILLVVFLT